LLFLQSARLTLGRRATSGVHQSLMVLGLVLGLAGTDGAGGGADGGVGVAVRLFADGMANRPATANKALSFLQRDAQNLLLKRTTGILASTPSATYYLKQ